MQRSLLLVVIAILPSCRPSNSVPTQDPPRVRAETTIGPARDMTREEVAREQRLGTSVDTILLRTTQLELRVGDTYNILSLMPVGQDRGGRPVRGFTPTFVKHNDDVSEISLITLRALRPGVDTLYVEALPREDETPRRPSTRVTIVVRP